MTIPAAIGLRIAESPMMNNLNSFILPMPVKVLHDPHPRQHLQTKVWTLL